MFSDRQLKRWYREINLRYHGGELPGDIDIIYAPADGCSGLVEFEAEQTVLTINPKYFIDTRAVRLTLHHEMVHIKIGKKYGHGQRFHKEMLRLAELGAFKSIW